MKISCTQENINQGLFVTSHIASKNTALPILNNVLIQAESNTIKLSSTNLEIGVSCVIRGKVEADGEFTVNSKLFADYISLLPKDRVDIEVVKNESVGSAVKVSCKNNHTKINGQEASDFPLIPNIDKKSFYEVDYQALREAISQVIFAVSVSETRPEINGVLFSFEQGNLVLAATDSYRLAEKRISLKNSTEGSLRVIVPTRTLQELQRILGSFKDPASLSEVEKVTLFVSENQIMFSFGNVELISRLIEGQYPDYQQIIPAQGATKAVIDTADLVKSIKTASLFARSGIYDVSLEFSPEKEELIISAANNQLGENISKVSAEVHGGHNNIAINYRYLLDGLQNISQQTVDISVIDADSPFLLKPGGTDDYLYLVMPLKQ